jgi:hypothetical protein
MAISDNLQDHDSSTDMHKNLKWTLYSACTTISKFMQLFSNILFYEHDNMCAVRCLLCAGKFNIREVYVVMDNTAKEQDFV